MRWKTLPCTEKEEEDLGRDRFASSGRGIISAGGRIFSLETINQTETGRRWLTMFTFLRLQLHKRLTAL